MEPQVHTSGRPVQLLSNWRALLEPPEWIPLVCCTNTNTILPHSLSAQKTEVRSGRGFRHVRGSATFVVCLTGRVTISLVGWAAVRLGPCQMIRVSANDDLLFQAHGEDVVLLYLYKMRVTGSRPGVWTTPACRLNNRSLVPTRTNTDEDAGAPAP